MQRLKLAAILAFAILAGSISKTYAGPPPSNNWTLVGPSPGGGFIIVGNGVSLGALSQSTNIPLSGGGFDQVTLNMGGVATANGVDTILFATSNDAFTNNGTVIGASGFNAVSFLSAASLSGETITNNGVIMVTGLGNLSGVTLFGNTVNNQVGGNIGCAVDIGSGAGISGLSLVNLGSIAGGSIGNLSGGSFIIGNFVNSDVGGNVGAGIAIDSMGAISTLSLSTQGSVTGGSIGNLSGGSPIFGNASTFDVGGNVGAGIAIDSMGAISTLALSTQGSVTGGSIGNLSGGVIHGNVGSGDVGGNVGAGIAIDSMGAISTLSLSTQGSVTGGSIGNLSASGNIFGNIGGNNDVGGNVGAGIAITSADAISGLSVINHATVTGGSIASLNGISSFMVGNNTSNDVGGNIGAGIAITSAGAISGLSMVNHATVTGGGIGNLSNSSISGNFGSNDVGGNIGTGIAITSGGAINGLVFKNYGAISGGSIGALSGGATVTGNNDITDIGGDVLSAIAILSGAGGSGNVVSNYGTITGGNSASGNAGMGINSNTGGLTVNNWGVINAGSGISTATQPNFPAVAISVAGNNNTINVNGHSSVNGTIQGSGVNNVLNLNFTGVSPQALANLKAQLAAQGWPGTNNFTGTFTLRGVTYYIDPLTLNINGITSYEGQALTPNQFAVGASLDSALVNPPVGSPLFNLYNTIDLSGNVPGALEALSPQKYEVYGDLAIANATATVQNVDARLNNIRDGSESIDTTGVGGGSDAAATAGFSKDDGKESKEIVPPPAPEKRWGMFATGDGLFFRGNPHDVDLQEGKSNTAGTVAGVDAKVGDHVILGALFAYDNADATLGTDGSHATIESYTGGLYGDWHMDGFYLNGLAAYTRNNYSSDRNIVFPGFSNTASAGTNGNQYTANLDGGYDWHVTDRLTVGPLAGVQYVHLDVNGFNESGAGAADLAVGSQSMNSLQSRVGGRINFHILTQEYASFSADLHAAWQHEFMDESRGINASFIGDGLTPFSIQTAAPLRDAAVVGIGLNFTFHDRLTLFADYELVLWQASYFEQTLNGGCRIRF